MSNSIQQLFAERCISSWKKMFSLPLCYTFSAPLSVGLIDTCGRKFISVHERARTWQTWPRWNENSGAQKSHNKQTRNKINKDKAFERSNHLTSGKDALCFWPALWSDAFQVGPVLFVLCTRMHILLLVSALQKWGGTNAFNTFVKPQGYT